MKGFAERADVEDVEHFLAATRGALRRSRCRWPSARVACSRCDVVAEIDVPGFARSAMDGYAVRGEDTFGASRTTRSHCAWSGRRCRARRSRGAWSGLRRARDDGRARARRRRRRRDGRGVRGAREAVAIREAVAPHKNVGAIGEDIRARETVLRAGRVLRPQDAGLLASIGARDAVRACSDRACGS
jgi:molybdopterin molybdotransferase